MHNYKEVIVRIMGNEPGREDTKETPREVEPEMREDERREYESVFSPSSKPKSSGLGCRWIIDDDGSNKMSGQSHTSVVNSHYSGKNSNGKDMVKVNMQLPDGKFESISFSPDDGLTVGWLHSEYFRILVNAGQNLQGKKKFDLHEVRLCTVNRDMSIDYLLSDYSESLDFLKSGINLTQFKSYDVQRSLTMKDMTVLKNIGVGGFSKVFLVRRNDTGQFYALKVCSKKDLGKSGKEEYAFNEKKLLTKLSHQFINRFIFSFQTQNHLCFGLDFCSGGCLYDLLRKHEYFPEEVTRAAIAQVALAIDYLHKKGVIYRDLKVYYYDILGREHTDR